MQAHGDAGHRTVHGDGEGPADANEIAVTIRQLLVRAGRKHCDVMATAPESGGKITDVLGDPTRVRVVIGRHEADLHQRLPVTALASGESSNGGPPHTGPVAADPPELQLGDATMRHEIPVLPEGLRLACHDGLLYVLGTLAGEGRIPRANSLQVVAVGAADLRKVEPALVQAIDLRGAGASGDRWVEGLHRIEVDVG